MILQKSIVVGCSFFFCSILTADVDLALFDHHPDIQLSLYAAEPGIVDPVALAFAANGDCFVVEMRDYPYGFGTDRKPGGTIRLLRDTNQDGRADQSFVFAQNLSYPTSVTPWKNGILVVAPPDIIYLEDTDGDNKADLRNVWITGLRLGVTDSNANSIRWGPDNWFHVANGGNGGTVSFTDSEESVRLGNSDFAFHPETKQIVRTYHTGGGFGLVFDDFGNSFTTYNINYLQQRMIPVRHIEQSPAVVPFKGTANISDHGKSARIFPIVEAETRVNHPEQAGHFSSAGGMGILTNGPFSDRLLNSIFVCDVVCNLVHRDGLYFHGGTYRAKRRPEELDREFLASRDPSFRPVGLEHGPDGALYLLDMQRDVIEHPDYIPQAVLKNLNIRAGDDRGRIYRIRPSTGLATTFRPLHQANTKQLVDALGSTQSWRSRTAQRLLIEQAAEDTESLIRKDALHSTDVAKQIRGLNILRSINRLNQQDIVAAFSDSRPEIRETALRLGEELLLNWPAGQDQAVSLLQDKDARVRFQAALAVRRFATPQKVSLIASGFSPQNDGKFPWHRRALLISAHDVGAPVLNQYWAQLPTGDDSWKSHLQHTEIIRSLAEVAAAGTQADHQVKFIHWISNLQLDSSQEELAVALISGATSGWRRNVASRPDATAVHLVLQSFSKAFPNIHLPLLDLAELFGLPNSPELNAAIKQAAVTADSMETPVSRRIAAIELLSRVNSDAHASQMLDLLVRPEQPEIHQAALASLRRYGRPESGQQLVDSWSELGVSIRSPMIQMLLSIKQYHDAILNGLESGKIKFSELNLDLEQRRTLLRWSSPEIGQRAAKLFGDEEYSNRKDIVTAWLAKLPKTGDFESGKQVFQKKCSQCHVAKGHGKSIGPSLESVSHRSVEDLVTHILDPNMSINPNYVSCSIETTRGTIVSGLLKSQTPNSILLVDADAKEIEVPRSEIEVMRTLTTSLMPEGIEKEVTPEQLRSLIDFLQTGSK